MNMRSTRSAGALVAVAALGLTACGAGAGSGGAGSAGDDGADGAQGTNRVVTTIPKAERQPAPDLSGTTTRGKPLDLADYRGKVVVLNLWGSNCAPCIAEAPHFTKVAKATEAKGVRFVGITRDVERSRAVDFEDKHHTPYPSLFDPGDKLVQRFPKGVINPQVIPVTVALDRKGRPAARSLGALDEGELRALITPLLAEK
ncbi:MULTISPECIES: TlpA family protein disulfide reductase [unclassified Streptomyces]|uniref:TlpA family protein disulfide reductase n=1 Tax=unclassified Streptomyces TaxID=2593676 RepID=UPI00381690AB